MKMRRVILSLFGANFLVYGLNAVYNTYLPIYLGRYFDEITMGMLLSIGPIVLIISPLIWGRLTDRAKHKNTVLIAIILCAAVSFIAASFSQNLLYTAVILAVMMFFMAPFGGLVDTITLECATNASMNYGPVRLMGTFGYGLIAFLTGAIQGSGAMIPFVTYGIVAVLAASAVKLSPQVEGHAVKKEKASLAPIFKDRNLMLIFIIIFICMFVWSYYMNFMPTYMLDTLHFDSYIWGLNIFITVLGEIPFFLFFDKIMYRFSIKQLLFATVLASVLRYVLLGICTNQIAFLAVGLVTGVWITIAIYCAIYHINLYMPDNIKATAQGVMYALTQGIPKVFAGIGGGYLTRWFGVAGTFFLCAALCAAALLAVAALKHHPSPAAEKKAAKL